MTEMQTAIAADVPPIQESQKVSEIAKGEILNSLKIKDIEKFASIVAVIPSTSGKYIVQIDQLHVNSADPEKTDTQTVAAQEEIGTVLDYMLKLKPDLKICPESLVTVSEFESTKADFKLLEKRFQNANDDTEGLEILKKWIDSKRDSYTVPYVKHIQMRGAALYEKTFQHLSKVNSEELQKLNPFGKDAWLAGGIIEKKFFDGELSKANIAPCESLDIGRSFGKVLQELQSKNEELSSDDIDRFNKTLLAREDYIVQALNKYLAEDSQSEYIVLVIGAIHDLSDNVLQQNTETEASTGYIRLRAKTTNEAFERIMGQSEDK
jgi:hypothetical protein